VQIGTKGMLFEKVDGNNKLYNLFR
jgi:hypothetical protein